MLDQLYRDHHAPALRTLRRYMDADQAEDTLMTAWAILARKLTDQPGYLRPDTARAWLVTVARHEHYAHLARRGPLESLDDGNHPTLEDRRAPATIHAHLELAELLEHIGRLTPGQQRSQLAAMLGLSYIEEQHATGCTYTAVNRGRTEGRKALRGHLA